MSYIETVKIVMEEAPGGFCIINKSDFNPETMELYGAVQKSQPQKRKRGRPRSTGSKSL